MYRTTLLVRSSLPHHSPSLHTPLPHHSPSLHTPLSSHLPSLHTPSHRRHLSSHSNPLPLLSSRGLLQDLWPQGEVASHQLAARLARAPVGVYAGFDPTADSLHVGNLLVLVGLLHFQRAGHRVVALLGGATARIGDPSGRNSERQELEEDQLEANLGGIRENIERVVANHSTFLAPNLALPEVEVVNNDSWYRELSIVDFLGSVGRRLRISRMLGRSSVKARLETQEGMSLTEFTYQALQAFDWRHLHRSRGCEVQLGGGDQLGNMVAGQEVLDGAPCWGVLLPLITDEQGSKFGKSAGSPVWLDRRRTSTFDFYQFFLRQPDHAVGALLRQFTFLPEQEVAALEERGRERPEERIPQAALARQVTLLVHGEEGLSLAERTTAVLYQQDVATLARFTPEEAGEVFQGAPYLRRLFQPGTSVLDLANMVGCFKHERDAMRIIGAGGFYINTVRMTNIEEVLVHGKHIMANDLTLVRVGKKNHYIVEWT